MGESGCKRALRAYAVYVAALTLLLGAVLCAQAVLLYAGGVADNTVGESGQLIEPVYTRGKVLARWGDISWLFYIWLGAAAAGAVFWAVCPPDELEKACSPKRPGNKIYRPGHAREWRYTRHARAFLLAAAIVLIALGVFNDGVRDVLYKASMICSECIGLG